MKATVSVALVVLCFCIQGRASVCPPSPSSSQQILVSPDCTADSNCTVLADALDQLDSFSVLCLMNGTHTLTRYTSITDLHDVTVLGAGRDAVTVTCEDRVGLSFVNITGLTLSGFTISGCGLTGPNANISSQLMEDIELLFAMPLEVRYAVVLGNCWNVSLQDLHVTKTRGMGLLAINIMGVSVLQEVNFTLNIRPSCISGPARYPFQLEKSVYDQIGGGAYFLYQDYHSDSITGQNANMSTTQLVITDSYFGHNAECSYAGINQVNFQRFSTDLFLVGGGGGLSIFLAQSMFNVDSVVTDSVFIGNDARYGAGAHVGMFTGLQRGRVTFRGCLFEGNGAEGDASELLGGAGLAVFADLLSPKGIEKPVSVPSDNLRVMVIDTIFVSNVARVEGGGVLFYSLFNTPHRTPSPYSFGFYTITFLMQNCTFDGNSAPFGAAAYTQQNAPDGPTGTLQLLLFDVTFSNSLTPTTFNIGNDRIRSAVALHNTLLVIGDTVVCSDNELTGLLLQSTFVLMLSQSKFLVERNTGQLGGGIHMTGEGTFIAINDSATFSLQNNTGTLLGGAIYVSDSILSSDLLRPIDPFSGCIISPFPYRSCFLDDCYDITQTNVTIVFAGNRAPRGSVVYGSTLATCTWTHRYRMPDTDTSIYQVLFDEVDVVEIDLQPNSSFVVSTPPAEITILLNVSGGESPEVIPGESVTVFMEVYDQFGHVIPGTLTSRSEENSGAHATLGTSGLIFTDDATNTAMLTVNAPEGESFEVLITELNTLVSTNLSITTRACPQGYSFAEASMSCECNQTLVNAHEGIRCDLDNFTLVSPDEIWLGSTTENATTKNLAIGYCSQVLGYCNSGEKTFTPPYYDTQCRKGWHRAGVLCGGCLPTYSVTLGVVDAECKRCSNLHLLLIPLFGLLGIILFFMIAFLEVTVEKGWVYSILFYSNLVSLSPLPSILSSFWEIFFFTPAFMLTFEMVFGLCLYDGMTALSRTFFKLLFPLFLFILMILVSLLGRKVTLNQHFAFPKTFVTLAMMSYTSILFTCVQSVSATTLITVGGERHVRWVTDPNVLYFTGVHIVLFIVASLLLIIYVIPVPFLLLSPRVAYKFKRMVPFLDVAWAPFKPKWRFWLGVRLLVRVLLFFTRSFLPADIGSFVSGLVVLVLVEVQLIAQPFEEAWVNTVDSVLIGSIVAITLGLFFFKSNKKLSDGALFFVPVLAFGYCLVIGMIVYHLATKFELKKKLTPTIMAIKKRLSRKKVTQTEISLSTLSPAINHESAHGVEIEESSPSPPQVNTIRIHHPSHASFRLPSERSVQPLTLTPHIRADFSRLRESLLEPDSL